MNTREKSSFDSMSPSERVRLVAGDKSISSFAKAKVSPLPKKRAQEIGKMLSRALQQLEREDKTHVAL